MLTAHSPLWWPPCVIPMTDVANLFQFLADPSPAQINVVLLSITQVLIMVQ